jgi:hypothetical protein
MKRYFIIFYTGIDEDNKQTIGESTCISENGKYFSRASFIEYTKKDKSLICLIITNIIELTENDFNCFKQ